MGSKTFFGRRKNHIRPPTSNSSSRNSSIPQSNSSSPSGSNSNSDMNMKGGSTNQAGAGSSRQRPSLPFMGRRNSPSGGFVGSAASTRSSDSFSLDAHNVVNVSISSNSSGSRSTNSNNKSKNNGGNMDVDIIKGAEILRRQLSHDNHNSRDEYDWSPWRREQETSKASNNNNNTGNTTYNYGGDTNDDIFDDIDEEEDRRNQGPGYLPTQWLSGLSSSSSSVSKTRLNGINTNSSNNRRRIDTPSLNSHNLNDDRNDTSETSTLDFLANLHVHDNDHGDMNIVQYHDGDEDAYEVESSTSHVVPRVTSASEPFSRMISPSSYIYGELYDNDEGFRHAVSAGNLWQSLSSQHVKFPALWWDGSSEPTRGPTMGSVQKFLWTYLGRHRVQGDRKLNSLIGNRGSSGRLLLHLVVRDVITGETIEDIACGCYHPNARGVRTTQNASPQLESCRDIWIAHRRRHRSSNGDSTIESLLKHQLREQNERRRANGGTAMSMDTPLGNPNQRIHNGNMKDVFGSKPPLFTVFVDESDLFELFQSCLDGSTPASVVLLRRYLRYRIG
mmetsp:Transcript_20846/g.49493  ORF Transcript_20846/g.49493 Transcript_20846/m.49493 type:complete len:559 (+) Transcript_20846:405-2081(+)